VSDQQLRQEYQGKVDWPHMTPEQRRVFLDTLNEPPPAAVRAARRKRKKRSPARRR
jgi:hypothetical protein